MANERLGELLIRHFIAKGGEVWYSGRMKANLMAMALMAAVCCGCADTAAKETPGAYDAAYLALGQRVWKNECAGTVQGLVSWNAGEAFPSLGIGHFIWYPAGQSGPFEESFPKLIAYAEAAGVPVPSYLRGAAPWADRAAFMADKSGKSDLMRRWLAEHVDVQARFLIARSRASLANMLRHSRKPQAVRAWYEALSRTPQGMYCLVDYVNFKGEGTKPTERYNGQGWGLLQVLEAMQGTPRPGAAAASEFARAAEQVIRRRVQLAPPARKESRWLPGWVNRCHTYRP